MNEQFHDSFREEAYDLLNHLEDHLLQLEAAPEDDAHIDAVFRTIHTIKGSAGMFGFTSIAGFTHGVENTLDRVRHGELPVTAELIGLMLEARDHTRELLGYDQDAPEDIVAAGQAISDRFADFAESARSGLRQDALPEEEQERLHAIGEEETHGGSRAEALRTGASESTGEPVTYRISFGPDRDIMMDGTDPVRLMSEVGELGDATSWIDLSSVPTLSQIEPEQCYTAWDTFVTTTHPQTDVEEIFMFVEGRCSLRVERIDSLTDIGDPDDEATHRIGQILVERGVVNREVIEQAAERQQRLGEMLIKSGVPKREVESALAEQRHVTSLRKKAQAEMNTASIRVASEKLDALIDLVGELVTLQARLSQSATDADDPNLISLVENHERLIAELRDNAMSVRMLPIGSTFGRFRRLVRDLSVELGKEVTLETAGAETELDKTVIEKLSDPLVHMIRNSVDHGIELPSVREEAGKPRGGHVLLRAEHSGANVVVTVEDDGKGLDAERIRAKAIERGLIAPGADLSRQEAFRLIFEPGFSTAGEVTTVSGRGVGMDVVRRQIEALGGSIMVDSEPGEGSTIRLSIPLTLAIIEGLLVSVGDETFVIPLQVVNECLEFNRSQIDRDRGFVNNRGEVLSFVELRRVFGIPGQSTGGEQMIVTEVGDQRIGIVVDRIIGDNQTVIKNMGRLYRDVEGVSGATILGDGSIALIVDVPKLVGVERRGRRRGVAGVQG